MSQFEDRLRTALLDTPMPSTAIVDPLEDLDRRLARARVRCAAAAVAAVALLVAAIVVPLSLAGSTGGSGPLGQVPPGPTLWRGERVMSLAVSGDGSVWTLRVPTGSTTGVKLIERHEPDAGEVVQSHRAGTCVLYLTAGAGRVWAWGGGDGGYPDGCLEALDPATGRLQSINLGRHRAIPLGFGGSPLAANGDQLVGADHGVITAYRPGGHGIGVRVLGTVPGAQLVLSNERDVVFSSGSAVVGQVHTSQPIRRVGPGNDAAITYSGRPLAADGQGVWAVKGGALVHEGPIGNLVGAPVAAPAAFGAYRYPDAAVVDQDGGLYIGYAAANGLVARALAYYPASVLASHHPAPAATLTNLPVFDLSADIAGGVVFVEYSPAHLGGPVARWDPTAAAKAR
jgi:sugar lactone lactonase YvrE